MNFYLAAYLIWYVDKLEFFSIAVF